MENSEKIKEVNSTNKDVKLLNAEVITVRELLETTNLAIPAYQRPYKWTIKNVNALLDDILHFKKNERYRLGTVVYNLNPDEEDEMKIVDGQQRSITLALIALAIKRNQTIQTLLAKHRFSLPRNTALTNFEFNHPISQENIRTNYREIQRRIVDFDFQTINFFFNQCEVVKVVLDDISEAFQFFDSQNARGRDLAPHDLLKAFHLREISSETSEDEINLTVEKWEEIDSKLLEVSFSEYLFRIRNWSKGKSAKQFNKINTDEFKGISPNIKEPYPYADMYRIAHFYIEGYNAQHDRKIDKNHMSFPFQLDQIVINGKRFFEMIHHYISKIQELTDTNKLPSLNSESIAKEIFDCINSYDARTRTGDRYVRNLFDTAVIYYIDKFGYEDLERAIEKIFVWAFSLRLKLQSVQLVSMDNYAREKPYIFKGIREALQPSDFLNISIPLLSVTDYSQSNKSGKLESIILLFQKLNYIK